MVRPSPFGTLGVGGGFALGQMLSDHRVIIIWGDGASGFSWNMILTKDLV